MRINVGPGVLVIACSFGWVRDGSGLLLESRWSNGTRPVYLVNEKLSARGTVPTSGNDKSPHAAG
jgi:hypothetical protein